MVFSLEDLCHATDAYFFQDFIAVTHNRPYFNHNFTSLLSYFYKHYRNIVQSAIPICCQYQLCTDL